MSRGLKKETRRQRRDHETRHLKTIKTEGIVRIEEFTPVDDMRWTQKGGTVPDLFEIFGMQPGYHLKWSKQKIRSLK